MATNYTIHVSNQSNSSQAYSLCQVEPIVEPTEATVGAEGNKITQFSSVYLTAPVVANGEGIATFKAPRQYYAICGTSTLTTGVSIITGDFEDVSLASGDATTTAIKGTGIPGTATKLKLQGENVKFDNNEATTTTNKSGYYSVDTTAYIAESKPDPATSSAFGLSNTTM
jgi:hypothetical protein